MNLFAKKSWFGLSKGKRTRKKQLWEESQKEEHPPPSVAGPVLSTGGWGLTTAPWPWLVEDLSSYTYSCPGGSTTGSSIEGASCAAACFFSAHYLLFPRCLLASSLSLIPKAGAKQKHTCSVRTSGQVRCDWHISWQRAFYLYNLPVSETQVK